MDRRIITVPFTVFETYSSTVGMENGISLVKTNAPGASIEDLTVDG